MEFHFLQRFKVCKQQGGGRSGDGPYGQELRVTDAPGGCEGARGGLLRGFALDPQ